MNEVFVFCFFFCFFFFLKKNYLRFLMFDLFYLFFNAANLDAITFSKWVSLRKMGAAAAKATFPEPGPFPSPDPPPLDSGDGNNGTNGNNSSGFAPIDVWFYTEQWRDDNHWLPWRFNTFYFYFFHLLFIFFIIFYFIQAL
jgi:hypothetical protein